MAIVFNITGGVPGSIEVKDKPIVIGRAPSSDVVIGSEFASGQHCIIFHSEGHIIVKDLKSTNGTMLNGELVKTSKVCVGDLVSVGRVEIILDKEKMTEQELQLHSKQNGKLDHTQIAAIEKTKVPFTSNDETVTSSEVIEEKQPVNTAPPEAQPAQEEPAIIIEKEEAIAAEERAREYQDPIENSAEVQVAEEVEEEKEESVVIEKNEAVVGYAEFMQGHHNDDNDALGRVHHGMKNTPLELSQGMDAEKRKQRRSRLQKLQETISAVGVQKLFKMFKKKEKK